MSMFKYVLMVVWIGFLLLIALVLLFPRLVLLVFIVPLLLIGALVA